MSISADINIGNYINDRSNLNIEFGYPCKMIKAMIGP
jgi:hypothetical protein